MSSKNGILISILYNIYTLTATEILKVLHETETIVSKIWRKMSDLRRNLHCTQLTTFQLLVGHSTSTYKLMGAVSSSQPSVSITAGSALYTVHVHVEVELVKKVCFINGTKIILLSVIEIGRWHWEEVQTTVTTTVTIKCTCKHTDELLIWQHWLHWLYNCTCNYLSNMSKVVWQLT